MSVDDSEPVVLDPEDPAFSVGDPTQAGQALGAGRAMTRDLKSKYPAIAAPAGSDSEVMSTTPVPSLLLNRLALYATGRLQAGEANALLTRLGADQPAFIAAYRVGYLPATYQDALSKDDRRHVKGHHLGNRLILPAYDAMGQVVDLFAVKIDGRGTTIVSGMAPEPMGLLAPALSTSHSELLITDAVATLLHCIRQGFPHTLLLRGAADARLNADRLLRAGVNRVIMHTRHDDGGIADALAAIGITVSGRTAIAVPSIGADGDAGASSTSLSVSPAARHALPDRLRIVSEDRTAEVVLIEAGPIRYAVERGHSSDDPRRLVVIRALGQVAQDRFALDSEPQRRRFAGNASQRLGIPLETLTAHLDQLGPLLAGRDVAEETRHLAAVPDAERSAAEVALAAPDLLARIVDDLTALGWMGEARAKAVLYLTGISRLLPQPLWTAYRSTAGSSPWQGTALIAALTPPEERLIFHRLTDSSIRQQDAQHLRHRLIIVDQAENLRPEAALALRVLKERGGIGWATLAAEPAGEARGPVAALAAAASDLDVRCRDCFVTVPADERPEQTEQVLAEQRRQHGSGALPAAAQASIVARHHALQRLLMRRPVIIPDAHRIIFPATQVRNRSEQPWLLTLIEAIALLYQRQREERNGAIVATEADIAVAIQLAEGIIAVGTNGLSRSGQQLLHAITARHLATFTMPDLAGVMPDWSRWAFRTALQDLIDFGYLEGPPPQRGKLRTFSLTIRATVTPLPAIRLRDSAPNLGHEEIRRVGELAEVGGVPAANVTREVASG